MYFSISSVLAKKLGDDIRQNPMQDNEVRRISGMGDHYIAHDTTDISEQGLDWMFKIFIDKVLYKVCVKL